MRIDLARLNHVLIPQSKEGRDRFRRGLIFRLLRPIFGIVGSFTREGQLFATVTLIAAGLGLDVVRTDVYLLFCVLAGVGVASLAISRAFVLRGVVPEVVAPRRVTVGDVARFEIVCRNTGADPQGGMLVGGPFLPWHGQWQPAEPASRFIAGLEPGETGRAAMCARFVLRGEHHLDTFRVAARVPFGLSLGPPVETGGTRIVVVPKPANVTRLTMPLGRRHQPGGVALASKSGESMDLLGVRPYRPGDPVRDLHAKSWARTGAPVVREYQQEYFSRVGVVLDTGTTDPERLEAAISLAAGIVAHLSRGEALIDLLVVGDAVHELTLGRSLGFLEQALDLLACVRRGPPPNVDALLRRLGPRLSRLSTVVVVSVADDATRRALVERIGGTGVGCAYVLVDEARQRAVIAGEALAL